MALRRVLSIGSVSVAQDVLLGTAVYEEALACEGMLFCPGARDVLHVMFMSHRAHAQEHAASIS